MYTLVGGLILGYLMATFMIMMAGLTDIVEPDADDKNNLIKSLNKKLNQLKEKKRKRVNNKCQSL